MGYPHPTSSVEAVQRLDGRGLFYSIVYMYKLT